MTLLLGSFLGGVPPETRGHFVSGQVICFGMMDYIIDNMAWHPPIAVPTEGTILPIDNLHIFMGMVGADVDVDSILDSWSDGYESSNNSSFSIAAKIL